VAGNGQRESFRDRAIARRASFIPSSTMSCSMSTTKLSLSSFGKRKGRTRGGTPWLADERLQPPFARRVGRVMPSFFMRKRSVFYGNLYHLNAEEEPELPDYPKDPAFRAKYGPRGVMDCKASSTDDPTVDPRFGKVGKQVCKDTGPLTRARMLTIDDDIANRAVEFIQRQNKAGNPVFVWVNFTHMHLRTHTKPESLGQSGRWQSPYHDTMTDHDKNLGQVLKALDDLGIADNTFVMYSTDNGPHMNNLDEVFEKLKQSPGK
jgi:arylsulfatase A-like enzyme